MSTARITAPHERMALREYLSLLQGEFAENDAAAWRTFFDFRAQFPELSAIEQAPVDVFLGRYAFYLNPLDEERDGLNWALSTSIIDYPVAPTFAQFKADLPALRELIEKPVVTDSFMFADGYGEAHEGIIGLNSPVAKLYENFELYLESLTSERRKKYRRADDELSEFSLRFEFSQEPFNAAEMGFIEKNIRKKWGEDYLYALCQSLWAVAVARTYPAQFYAMRVYDGDKLVFLQTMIARGQTMFCQSIVKDEETHYNGIAAYTDVRCVKALCGSGFQFFDPSCRTGLNDPESIGIAKRASVNHNLVKPIFVAGHGVPEAVQSVLQSKQIQGKLA